MKTILIVLINIMVSQSYKFYDNPKYDFQCDLVQIIKDATCTILLDMENNTDIVLKKCMIKSCSRQQSLLVLQGNRIPRIKANITCQDPNLLIYIESLGPTFFQHTFLSYILKSAWSMLYLVITSNKNPLYECKNGSLSKEGLAHIESFVNYLWHNYQTMHIAMAFPFICPKKIVIYDGKKPSGGNMVNRTIKLIGGSQKQLSDAIKASEKKLTEHYPLRANLFYRFPTSIVNCDKLFQYVPLNRHITRQYCGLDALIMQDIVSYFKFNITFPKLDYCNSYGYASPENKLASGSLGCVIRNDIDVSFNARFMEPSPRNFHYLFYVKQDSLCVLLPRPQEVPLWHYPFNIYKPEYWVFITLMLFLAGFVMWAIDKVRNKMADRQYYSLRTSILNAFTSTLIGFSVKRDPRFSILQTSCFCMSIVLTALYQSNVNYLFTTTTRVSRLKNLQDLCNSNVVLVTSPSIKQLLLPMEDYSDACLTRYMRAVHMRKNSEDYPGVPRLNRLDFVLEAQNRGLVTRRSDIMLEVQLHYTDQAGRPMMYMIDECFRTYYLSIVASEKFPFTQNVRKLMERLIEGGFPNKYYKWARRSFGLPETILKFGPEPRPFAKVNMEDSCVAFWLLLIGYLVSTLAWIAERWYWRRIHGCYFSRKK